MHSNRKCSILFRSLYFLIFESVCIAIHKYHTLVNIFLLILVLCQGCERQTFLTLLAQFCRSTVNEEQCIMHKLLGDKFQVYFSACIVGWIDGWREEHRANKNPIPLICRWSIPEQFEEGKWLTQIYLEKRLYIITRSIWKMLGPFATASRLTPTHQVSLPVLSRAACALMSTTTTRDRGDRYGPMEWAQQI